MIELLLRRRMMAMSKKEPFVNPYITDGLVLHLDGIEKGCTPDAWTDLINGLKFKYSDGITPQSDHILLQSGHRGMMCDKAASEINWSKLSCTIEVCCTRTSYGILFWHPTNGQVSLGYFGNRLMFGTGQASHSDQFNPPEETNQTIGIRQNYGCGNGKELVRVSSTYWSPNGTVVAIGIRGTAYTQPFVGRLYGIRIYDRKLTQEEMFFNQAIDNTRFHLGLEL